MQTAESTWYGCQIVPAAISTALGSKPTTGERTIPAQTFRHTAFIIDNFESDYERATTIIKGSYLARRVVKPSYSVAAFLCAVCPRSTGEGEQQPSTGEN